MEDCDRIKELIDSTLNEVLEDKITAVIEAKITPFKLSVEMLNSSFDDIQRNISSLSTDNRKLLNDSSVLKSQTSHLWTKLNTLKSNLDDLEQYIRQECLKLKGIPVSKDKDTDEIVQSIGKLLDVEIDKSDISTSHRLPQFKPRNLSSSANQRPTPPTIIVKFTNPNIRDELYSARFNLKNYDTSDIGLGRLAENKIFIQESLTATKRKLFKQALELRKKRY